MKWWICVILIAAFLLVGFAGAKEAEKVEKFKDKDIVSGDVIIKYHGEKITADEVEYLGNDLILVHSDSKDTATLIDEFQSDPDVEYAEPNYIFTADIIPNDPNYNLLYGMTKISAPQAWDITTGSDEVVVTVIDTGIDYDHPDLIDNIWSAPMDFTVNISNTLITCPAGSHGFNAILNTCDPNDDHYHGSHCAGTIGATGNNGIGVAGVNWNTKIMGAKFLNRNGSGYTSDAIKAIEFIIQAKHIFEDQANVRVLSNSWGGGGFSQALLDEINKADTEGMLFVVAAGNSARDNDLFSYYPADYNAPNKIAVAATDSNDLLASFSSWGLQNVSLGAPGVSIYSTTINHTTGAPIYGYLSGTSMATPHVAGAAALILSKCDLNTADLKADILNNVDPIPALDGKTITGGRLNVAKAIESCTGNPPPVPTPTTPAPTPVTPTPTPVIPTPTPTPEPPRLIASFYATITQDNKPINTHFIDTSIGADTWLWNFGDGSISIERSPFHTYTKGHYTVSLTVTNGDLESTLTRKQYIKIGGSGG